MVTSNDYKDDIKKEKTFYISLGLFIFVLILNIGLYFYNSYVVSSNDELSQKISVLDQSIQSLNQDPSIQLYTLVTANKIYLERYRYISKVPEFINNLKELSKKYRIKFQGFSYSQGSISSYALVSDDEFSLGSVKAKRFMEYFRKNDSKDIFSLKFVNNFEGQTTIKFNTNFLVK